MSTNEEKNSPSQNNDSPSSSKVAKNSNTSKIKVEFEGFGCTLYFSFGRNTKIAKIMKLFITSAELHYNIDQLSFILDDGSRLVKTKLVSDYPMSTGDKVYVTTGSDGGYYF